MNDHQSNSIDRRKFLNWLLATTSMLTTGLALSPAWSQGHHGGHARLKNAAPLKSATPASGSSFANPPAITAGANGNYALNVAMRQATLGAQPINVMSFMDANNLPSASAPLVSPTITITGNGQPVQQVSVILTNNLPAEPSPQTPGPVITPAVNDNPHGYNTINLHTHGLHVAPLEDNVYLELQPTANGTGVACTPTSANPVWVCNGSYTYNYNFGKAPVTTANPTGLTKIPAGTYWYHPHKHGSVGVQVASGMVGAFIVKGDLDAIPGVAGLTENVMVAQLIEYTIPTGIPPQTATVSATNFYSGSLPANTQISINGQINPVVTMQYGEIQRLRFINATSEQFFYLNVAPAPGTTVPAPLLFAIAVDGVPLTNSPQGITVPFQLGTPAFQFPMGTAFIFQSAVMNEIAVLAPGQRLDLLVQMPANAAGTPQTYQLQAVSFPAAPTTQPLPSQTIATIQVSGSKATPDQLPSSSAFNAGSLYRPPLASQTTWPTSPTQKIQFGFIYGNTGGVVNNATGPNPFGTKSSAPPTATATDFSLPVPTPSAAQLNLKLGAIDYWQVSSDPTFGFGPHSFHIHINSFMMTKRNGVDISQAIIWRDTVRIDQPVPPPALSGGLGAGAPSPITPVEFVSQQVDYVGAFVLHCHVLQHEDAGMMWSVNIS
jgi:FtsP/CotA-like multicopper oxidase with cupredoxin domain